MPLPRILTRIRTWWTANIPVGFRYFFAFLLGVLLAVLLSSCAPAADSQAEIDVADVAAQEQPRSNGMQIWADVWDVVGPLVTLGAGGFITYYLKKLADGRHIVVAAAEQAAVAAQAAKASVKEVAVVNAQHLEAQDKKLDVIHNAVEYVMSDAAEKVAAVQKDHLDAQDVMLDEIRATVNGHKTDLEYENQLLRDALIAAGVKPPPLRATPRAGPNPSGG